jgi:hypothetical protein
VAVDELARNHLIVRQERLVATVGELQGIPSLIVTVLG